MTIYTTTKNLYREAFQSIRELRFIASILTFYVILFLLNTTTLQAQSPTLHLFSVTPEWNGKSFCGDKLGYHPTSIIAPSVSYSGKGVNEPVYEYYWEQQKNGGDWEVVKFSKESKFIPSFDPSILHNDKPGGPVMVYKFRLRVIDIANGNQTATSDEFTINIVSGMLASHEIVNDKNGKSIQLNIEGGFPEKKFYWSRLSGGSSTKFNNNSQQISGVSDGVYEVNVQDGGCPELSYKVTITN